MELVERKTLKEIISNSLENSLSYSDYRELVKQLVEHNSTTGNSKTEALANYTMLNDRRMKRWDKTIKIPQEDQQIIKAHNDNMTWLVITESWCGDAAHVMPVINRVAELNSNINLRVVLRDENEDLMNAFLTNGSQSIPKLIMIDSEGKVQKSYGPRPSEATKLVNDYKNVYGQLTPEFKENLQLWYNKDKGQNVISDLINLLKD